MSIRSQNDECKRIGNLILQASGLDRSESDREYIIKHTKVCASCRRLLRSVTVYEQSLNPETFPEINPMPQIRVNALAHMTKRTGTRLSALMGHFLSVRVPMYQAAVALLILLTSISVINSRRRIVHSKHSAVLEWTAYKEQSGYTVYPVQEYADSSQIGRNVLEDSLIFRSLNDSGYRHEIQKIDSVLSSGV